MTRIPKTFYSLGFVVSFRVKNNESIYNIHKWSEDGLNLALLKYGKYNGEYPKDLITSEIKSEQK